MTEACFRHRVLVVLAFTTAFALLLLFLWSVVDVLLLVFAGVLVAIFLRALSSWVSTHTPLSAGWSLACVVVVLVSIIGTGMWFAAPSVAAQIDQLVRGLPYAVRQLERSIGQYAWSRRILAQLPTASTWMPSGENVLARVTGIFSTTLGVTTNVVIILVVGLYLAIDPRLYTHGLIRLMPLGKRSRVQEVLSAVGDTLRWWLLGRLFSMTVIGVFTTLGLWLLDVPLALTLGLLAALLTFIPTIGPLLSAAPAVLLALLQSPTRAVYVVVLYLMIQAVETYLITPLVLRRTVELPPALTIATLTIVGVLFGFIGLLLASPLAATLLVLVKMLYVEDTLGDTVEHPYNHPAPANQTTGTSQRYAREVVK